MKRQRFTQGYIVRLERGEEITETLTNFLREENITAGTISGLGGIADAELGFYDLSSKTYRHFTVSGNLELVLYQGNITLVDGEPFIHAHAVVSGPDYAARSGHFFSARIIVTGEFIVKPADWKISRVFDETTGLKLMDIT